MPDYNQLMTPRNIDFINDMLIHRFKAIKVDKYDNRIKNNLNDPFIPPIEDIYGVYCIYQKSTMELLEGKISSIHSSEFNQRLKSDHTITADDLECILDACLFVVISANQDAEFVHYFIGGASNVLEDILRISTGGSSMSPATFSNSLKTVISLEYIDNLISEIP